MSDIFDEVIQERKRQDEKWGEQNHDPITYGSILIEEVGEFAEASLHLKFGGPEWRNVRTEAIHVAAVAIAIIECLDRCKWSFAR